MNINNFKISTKLTLGFGLMAVLLFLISATSLWKAKNLHDDFESVMHQQYPKVVKIEEIKDLLNTNELSISHMLHYKESASHEDLIEKVLATRAKIAEALQFLQTQEMDAEEQAILEAFKGPRLEYIDAQDRYIELVRDRRLDDALFLLILEMPNKRNAYHAALKNLVDVQNKLMNQSVEVASQSVTNMYWVIGAATMIVLLGATILSLWIIRSITRPIADAVRVADAVAELRKKHNKPIQAVIGNLGASAGYMVAMSADEIISAKYSLVGSIGAILQSWDVHNVFVPGGNAFPQNFQANPTDTIGAITLMTHFAEADGGRGEAQGAGGSPHGGQFGAGHLVDILRGASTERIRQQKHDTLTTYGLGADLSDQDWRSVIRQLLAGGVLGLALQRLALAHQGLEDLAALLLRLGKRAQPGQPDLLRRLARHARQVMGGVGVGGVVVFRCAGHAASLV